MDTQAEFVAKRLAAHTAACSDIFTDPLVQAAIADQAVARQVMGRWKALRETPVAPAATMPEYVYTGGPRRQAE